MSNRFAIRMCLIAVVMVVVSTIAHLPYLFPAGDQESISDGWIYWYETRPPGAVILEPLRYEAMDVENGSSREIAALIFDIGMPPDVLGNAREEQPVNVSKISFTVSDHNNSEYLKYGEWEIVDQSPWDGDYLLEPGETFKLVISLPFPVSRNSTVCIVISEPSRPPTYAEIFVPDEILESGALEFRQKNIRYWRQYGNESS